MAVLLFAFDAQHQLAMKQDAAEASHNSN